MLYKSIISDGKFIVLIFDGVFDTQLMELPTEDLADRVAFELQSAWDQGESWGVYQKLRRIKGDESDKDVNHAIQKLRKMTPAERESYHEILNQRFERNKKLDQLKTWEKVLSLKNSK
jgi:predicted CopG family antitoxin